MAAGPPPPTPPAGPPVGAWAPPAPSWAPSPIPPWTPRRGDVALRVGIPALAAGSAVAVSLVMLVHRSVSQGQLQTRYQADHGATLAAIAAMAVLLLAASASLHWRVTHRHPGPGVTGVIVAVFLLGLAVTSFVIVLVPLALVLSVPALPLRTAPLPRPWPG